MKLRKGVINLTDNSTKLQTVQVEGLAEEVADNVRFIHGAGGLSCRRQGL